MNTIVIQNFLKLKKYLFFLPLFLLVIIALFLYYKSALNAYNYTQIQKDTFFTINQFLGQFPKIEYNLTQLGDASIVFSFLAIFIIYAPKLCDALFSASIVSLVLANGFKNIFDVPRPAVVYDNLSFIIIGEKAVGYSSLPSGHSITIFTTLTILMFAFMPKKLGYKYLWFLSIIIIGLIMASSRVGVGAHHPLDVIIGSIIGYMSALIGIFISQKFEIWSWIKNKKYYPILILLMLICAITIVIKINNQNLFVFYFALFCFLVSIYKFVHVYIKK